MRMPVNELLHNTSTNIAEGKGRKLLFDFRMEDHLQHKVAKLFAKCVRIFAIDCIEHFIGFFQKIAAQRLMRLLCIPGTAARGTQAFHNAQKTFYAMPCKFFKFCAAQD